MIGLVLVTHGRLADEFVAALVHVLGPQEAVATVCIGPSDDTSQGQQRIIEAAKRVNRKDGLIILTDLFGGTPSNLAISVMEQVGAEVIAGVNLPLLIKLAELRGHETLRSCVAAAREAGQKYIKVASEL
jgi:PTS system mannose-specific IIA component